jgi:hypothetical protein
MKNDKKNKKNDRKLLLRKMTLKRLTVRTSLKAGGSTGCCSITCPPPTTKSM